MVCVRTQIILQDRFDYDPAFGAVRLGRDSQHKSERGDLPRSTHTYALTRRSFRVATRSLYGPSNIVTAVIFIDIMAAPDFRRRGARTEHVGVALTFQKPRPGFGGADVTPQNTVYVSPDWQPPPSNPPKPPYYTTFEDAVAYVTSQNPSATNQWAIIAYPGMYVSPAIFATTADMKRAQRRLLRKARKAPSAEHCRGIHKYGSAVAKAALLAKQAELAAEFAPFVTNLIVPAYVSIQAIAKGSVYMSQTIQWTPTTPADQFFIKDMVFLSGGVTFNNPIAGNAGIFAVDGCFLFNGASYTFYSASSASSSAFFDCVLLLVASMTFTGAGITSFQSCVLISVSAPCTINNNVANDSLQVSIDAALACILVEVDITALPSGGAQLYFMGTTAQFGVCNVLTSNASVSMIDGTLQGELVCTNGGYARLSNTTYQNNGTLVTSGGSGIDRTLSAVRIDTSGVSPGSTIAYTFAALGMADLGGAYTTIALSPVFVDPTIGIPYVALTSQSTTGFSVYFSVATTTLDVTLIQPNLA